MNPAAATYRWAVPNQLDPGEYADPLQSALALTSSQITPAMLERQIQRLKQQDNTALLKPTQALAKLIEPSLSFYETERVKALMDCEVYVVDLPLCSAFAQIKSYPRIVIGQGLMNLLCANSYWANFSEQLPNELEKHTPFETFPRLSVRDVIPLFLYGLLYRYFAYNEPLPDFSKLPNDQPAKAMHYAMAGAASFVLFHELGHIQLDHLSGDNIRPIDVPLLVDEDLNRYQQQELEADDYARQSLLEPHQRFHVPWINLALNFQVQMETLLSQRYQGHPLSLNRLHYANACSENPLMTPEVFMAHMQRMGDAYTNIESGNQRLKDRQETPVLLRWSRDELLQQLHDLDHYLQPYELSMEPALNAEPRTWYECLDLVG